MRTGVFALGEAPPTDSERLELTALAALEAALVEAGHRLAPDTHDVRKQVVCTFEGQLHKTPYWDAVRVDLGTGKPKEIPELANGPAPPPCPHSRPSQAIRLT